MDKQEENVIWLTVAIILLATGALLLVEYWDKGYLNLGVIVGAFAVSIAALAMLKAVFSITSK